MIKWLHLIKIATDHWVVRWSDEMSVSLEHFDTLTKAKKFRKELRRKDAP